MHVEQRTVLKTYRIQLPQRIGYNLEFKTTVYLLPCFLLYLVSSHLLGSVDMLLRFAFAVAGETCPHGHVALCH